MADVCTSWGNFYRLGYTSTEKNVCLTGSEGENYVFNAWCNAKKEGMRQVEQRWKLKGRIISEISGPVSPSQEHPL